MSTSTVQHTEETVEQQARAALAAFLTEHKLTMCRYFKIEWTATYEYERDPDLARLLRSTHGRVPNIVEAQVATRDDVLAAGKALDVEIKERTWIDEQPEAWYVYRRAEVSVDDWLPGVRLQIQYHERRTARPDRAPRRRRPS